WTHNGPRAVRRNGVRSSGQFKNGHLTRANLDSLPRQCFEFIVGDEQVINSRSYAQNTKYAVACGDYDQLRLCAALCKYQPRTTQAETGLCANDSLDCASDGLILTWNALDSLCRQQRRPYEGTNNAADSH